MSDFDSKQRFGMTAFGLELVAFVFVVPKTIPTV